MFDTFPPAVDLRLQRLSHTSSTSGTSIEWRLGTCSPAKAPLFFTKFFLCLSFPYLRVGNISHPREHLWCVPCKCWGDWYVKKMRSWVEVENRWRYGVIGSQLQVSWARQSGNNGAPAHLPPVPTNGVATFGLPTLPFTSR